MKFLIGILFILAGAIIGIYVSIYICLWGGAVDMVTAITAGGGFWQFIWGAIKFGLSGILGWIFFWIFAATGTFFFE